MELPVRLKKQINLKHTRRTNHKMCSLKKAEKHTIQRGCEVIFWRYWNAQSLKQILKAENPVLTFFTLLHPSGRDDSPGSRLLPSLLIQLSLPSLYSNLETETNALCASPWPGLQGLQNDDCFWQRSREENLFTALSMSGEMGCCLSISIIKCTCG